MTYLLTVPFWTGANGNHRKILRSIQPDDRNFGQADPRHRSEVVVAVKKSVSVSSIQKSPYKK